VHDPVKVRGERSSRLETALDQVDNVVRTSQRSESSGGLHAESKNADVTGLEAPMSRVQVSPAPASGGGGEGEDSLDRRRRERAAKRAAVIIHTNRILH
jgi:hypothetical protein